MPLCVLMLEFVASHFGSACACNFEGEGNLQAENVSQQQWQRLWQHRS
jgi:hypothetical protein